VFATGQGRKTDPVDVHSVAVAALRAKGLRQVVVDATVALRLLVDRRDRLGVARTETISRLHALLLELIPGGAKKYLSALQGPIPTQHRPAGFVGADHHRPWMAQSRPPSAPRPTQRAVRQNVCNLHPHL
jgi:hypothetical protein